MKKEIKIIILLLAVLSLSSQLAVAQCKSFTKAACKPELKPFVHDGIFNSTNLTEGESIELYKTFYSDQEYRLLVCSSDNLPTPKIQILDSDRNVLFDNTKEGLSQNWDFKLDETQMVVVSVVIPESKEKNKEIQQGCCSIMVGFKANLD